MTTVVKGVKLRLYPNQAQINQLWQLFGNDRFVWNQMLAMANKRYENNPKSQFINEYGMNYLLKPLKQEYSFLKASDSTSLFVVNHNLALAFKNLFQHRGGHPRFKSRHNAKQAYTGQSICVVEAKRRLRLPKLGSIRTSKTSQLADAKIKCYTVSHDATGRYYISLQLETEVHDLPKTNQRVGLDMGVADLAITSTGVKYGLSMPSGWRSKRLYGKQNLVGASVRPLLRCANGIMTINYPSWSLTTIKIGNGRGWLKRVIKQKSPTSARTTCIN
ncbi:hypothetical protein G8J22_00310 [Lentilactobacillus hilgardii]|nr:hypothetical protein G8J22_00310 [Lentilactobacillus hilgardii]